MPQRRDDLLAVPSSDGDEPTLQGQKGAVLAGNPQRKSLIEDLLLPAVAVLCTFQELQVVRGRTDIHELGPADQQPRFFQRVSDRFTALR